MLADLNHRPFKKLPGCRHSAFLALDRGERQSLPANRMAIARFKRARVNIDYHVELDGHYYSVPHRLVGTEVELRVTVTTVEVLASSVRVTTSPLLVDRRDSIPLAPMASHSTPTATRRTQL